MAQRMSQILAPVSLRLPEKRMAISEDGAIYGAPYVHERWSGMDARTIREELLKVENKEDCAAFLDRAGYAVVVNELIVYPFGPQHVSNKLLAHILEWRDTCRELLRSPSRLPLEWNSSPKYSGTVRHYAYQGTGRANALTVGFSWDVSGKPVLTAYVLTALEAAVVSCHLDRIAGFKFKQCRRPDCRAIYQVQSKQRRFYCSYECAHLETVRRGRRNAKKDRRSLRRRAK
jgi:hypothetical protein